MVTTAFGFVSTEITIRVRSSESAKRRHLTCARILQPSTGQRSPMPVAGRTARSRSGAVQTAARVPCRQNDLRSAELMRTPARSRRDPKFHTATAPFHFFRSLNEGGRFSPLRRVSFSVVDFPLLLQFHNTSVKTKRSPDVAPPCDQESGASPSAHLPLHSVGRCTFGLYSDLSGWTLCKASSERSLLLGKAETCLCATYHRKPEKNDNEHKHLRIGKKTPQSRYLLSMGARSNGEKKSNPD